MIFRSSAAASLIILLASCISKPLKNPFGFSYVLPMAAGFAGSSFSLLLAGDIFFQFTFVARFHLFLSFVYHSADAVIGFKLTRSVSHLTAFSFIGLNKLIFFDSDWFENNAILLQFIDCLFFTRRVKSNRCSF